MTNKNDSRTRAAFLVATWLYSDETFNGLSAPSRDVDKLAAVLSDPLIGNFEVEALNNPTLQELKLRLSTFLLNRKREDTGLIYFSGHGVLDDASQEYHIATRDTVYGAVSATALERDWVVKQLGLCRSKRLVVLLDTCHSGAFGGLSLKGVDTRALGTRFEGSGRAVIAAAGPLEYALDGSGSSESTSVFTGALLKGLESGLADSDRDNYVTIQELYEYICDEVRGQRPVLSGAFDGDIWLSQVPLDRRPIPELPASLRDALGSSSVFERLGALSELSELLSGDDPDLRRAVHASLSTLLDDDSFKVRSIAERILRTHDPEVTGSTDTEVRRIGLGEADPADAPDAPVDQGRPPSRVPREPEGVNQSAADKYTMTVDIGQWVQSMDVHPDGDRVAVGTRNGLTLVSLESGRVLAKVKVGGYANRTRDVSFSPDGQRLVAVSDDAAWYLFDTDGLIQRRKKQVRWFGMPGTLTLHAVRFLPNGQEFAVACGDGKVRVYAANGSQRLELKQDDNDAALALDIAPSGSALVVGHSSGTLVTWDLQTSGRLAAYALEGKVLSIAIAPSSRLLAAGTSKGIFIVDASKTPAVVRRIERRGPITSVAWSMSGEFLTFAAAYRVVSLSTDTWTAVASTESSAGVGRVRIVPTEGRLRVAFGGDDKQVHVVDFGTENAP
jgi:hypothetical protein